MPSRKKTELKFSKFYLPNGLKCILYKRSDVHSVNISVVVNTGALDETAKNNGIYHLIEHLPFDGTTQMPTWSKVNNFLNEISGSGNAYTSFDHTKYYGTFPYQYIDEALFYLAQLVFHPLHKTEDLAKEKEIILDEMKRYEDSIGHKIYRSMIENRFTTKDTNYCYEIIGTETNVRNFSLDDVKKYYTEAYVPSNMELYVVGNFNLISLKKQIKHYFYDLLAQKTKTLLPERQFHKNYPEYSSFNINTAQKLDVNQYYLTLSFPCYEFSLTSQVKRNLLSFLTSITASSQYQESVLWKRLREELGIVYGVNCWAHSMYNRAFLAVETSFNPEFLDVVVKEIYQGINTIKEGNVGKEIFQSRKKRIVDTEMMRYDNPNNVLSWIVDQEDEYEVHQQNLTIQQYIEEVKSTNFDDIVATARELFDWSKANITVVTGENADKIKGKVEKIWNGLVKS